MSRNTIIIVVFVYLTSILFGFVLPQTRQLHLLRNELVRKQVVLQSQQDRLESLNNLLHKMEVRKEEMAIVDQGLPEKPNISSLLEFVEKSLSQSGVIFKKIGDFSTVLVENENGVLVKETSVSIEITSKMDSFLDFLNKVERSAFLVEVDNISFSYNKKKDPFYNFQLVLRTRFANFGWEEKRSGL